MRQDLLWHSNRLEIQVYPPWEPLLWYYQAACRIVQHPHLHGLKLVHRPEWLWCCVVLLKSGWRCLLAVQLILPTTSFCTVNATPYWCFESSPQNQILCPSSMVETTVFKECLWSYCVNISQNKMNYDKAQIVWTGSRKHSKVRFLRDMNFCWNPGIFRVLGNKLQTLSISPWKGCHIDGVLTHGWAPVLFGM